MNDSGVPREGGGMALPLLRAAFQFLFSFALWGALLFWAAGTLDWTRAWLHIGLWAATLIINLFVLLKYNPAVIAARTKRARITGVLDWVILMGFALPATLAIPVVAGLDAVRFSWAALGIWAVAPGIFPGL